MNDSIKLCDDDKNGDQPRNIEAMKNEHPQNSVYLVFIFWCKIYMNSTMNSREEAAPQKQHETLKRETLAK